MRSVQAVAIHDGAQEQVGHTDDLQAEAQFGLPGRIALGDQLGQAAVHTTETNQGNLVFGHRVASHTGSCLMGSSLGAGRWQLNMAIRCIYWSF
ncbi:hypothetical protein D9M68_806480 [compost metagenome]